MAVGTAAELVTRITAEDQATRVVQRYIGNLKEAEKQTNGLGAAISGIAKNALSFAAGLGALSVAGDIFGAIKGSAIDLNSRLEQARIGFTTMLGSAEQADAFLRDLQKLAATTPFEFPELVDASKRLLAFGTAAKDVQPLLVNIGDTAAALGLGSEGVNRLTTAIGQMTAKGKVQGDELLQLAEAGINVNKVFEIMATQTGKSVEELKKMQSAGTLASSDFIKAFRTFADQNFGGLMEKNSKTLVGALSNIKDALGQAVSSGAKPFFDLLTEGANNIAAFLGSETFSGWAKGLSQILRDLATILGNVLRGVLPILGQEIAALGFIGKQVFDMVLVPAFRAALDLLGKLGAVFGLQLPTAQNALEGLAGGLTAFNNFLVAAIGTAMRFGNEVGKALAVPVTWVVQHWPEITQTIGNVMSTVGGIVSGALNALKGFWDENGGLILAAVQTAWTAISDVIGNVVNTLGPVIQGVMTIINGDWDTGWKKIQQTAIDFDKTLLSIIQQWAGTLGTWWSIVAPKLADFGAKLLGWAGDRVPEIQAKLVEWGAAYGDWVRTKAWPWLQEKLGELATNLITWVGDEVPIIFDKLGEWADNFADWVDVALPELLRNLDGLLDKLLGFVDEGSVKTDSRLGEWVEAFIAWARDRVWPLLGPALEKIGSALLTWMTQQVPYIWAKLGQWGLLFGDWVITEAIPKLILALGKLLIRLADWFITEGVPAFLRGGARLASGLIEGFVKEMEKLGPAIADVLSRTRVTVGPFHVSAEGVTVDLPGQAPAGAGGGGGGSGGGGGGGGPSLPPGTIPVNAPTSFTFDSGGLLMEPVFGRGLRSGTRYGFALTGPEAFGGVQRSYDGTPRGGGNITVVVNLPGGYVGRDQDIAKQLAPALREELARLGLTNLKIGNKI